MEAPVRTVLANSSNVNFIDNYVHTRKYTPLTFVPLFLRHQFAKPSNMFFLAIASLQVPLPPQAPMPIVTL